MAGSWLLTATTRYSGWAPLPETDANNLMPRIGFNWNPRTGKKGIIGFFTGGDKLVVRGGYSRTYDPIFMNLYVNMGTLVSLRCHSAIVDNRGLRGCTKHDGAGFVSGESFRQNGRFGRYSLSGHRSNFS